MKSLLTNWSCILALLCAAMLMPACSSVVAPEELETETPSQELCYFSFELCIPRINDTRTPSTGEYDPGSAEWENYIDIQDDLKFYIFDDGDLANNVKPKFLTVLPKVSTIILPDESDDRGSNYKRYKVSSILKKEKLTPPFRLVALANCGTGNYPTVDATTGNLMLGSTRIETLDDLAYSLTYTMPTPITQLDANQLIPMFGVSRITELPKMGGNEKPRIDMLRAWAKVDVMAAADETHDLATVTLHNYNTAGLICPTNVYQREPDNNGNYGYVHGDWTNDYVGHISLSTAPGTQLATCPFGVHHTTTLTRDDNTTVSRKVYTLYIPEYRNLLGTDLAADHSYITLKFDDEEDTHEYTVDFREYSYASGHYFDIERNNYYKYTVKRTDLRDLEVEVHPYYVEDLRPDFGIVTGRIVWEGVWSVVEDPMSMSDLRSEYFDWSEVHAGQYLTIYMLSRAPLGSPNSFWAAICRFDSGDPIAGTQTYVNPENGVLRIELTQAVLNDIIAHEGISILTRYCILYRVTIK